MSHVEQVLAIDRELGDRVNEAVGLIDLVYGRLSLGDLTQAQNALEASLVLLRTIGDHQVLARLGDPRAAEWLTRAHSILATAAGEVADPVPRHGLLHNIPFHREIVAAWASGAHRD